MNSDYYVLCVDDDQSVLDALGLLFDDKYNVITVNSGREAIDAVAENDSICTVVMDIKMPGIDGIQASRKIKEKNPDLPIIFHTGFPGVYTEDDIDASEKPFAYVQKGSAISRLKRAVRNAVEYYLIKMDNQYRPDPEIDLGIVGESRAIREVIHLIMKIAPSDAKVMITGETGTGKELVARALHKLSPQCKKRLAIFNCNHKSPDIVESELFGHKKGSFTGAITDRVGLFEYASDGTVFLDEIGDLDITTQAKLLRVLETGEYQSIGSPEVKTGNFRIICATHKNLEDMVEQEKFREDLYYRLNTVKIELPPLRDRIEDIPLLTRHFIDRLTIEKGYQYKIIEPTAFDVMMAYKWPGNIRQLFETIRGLILTTNSDIIMVDDVKRKLNIDSDLYKGPIQSLKDKVAAYRHMLIMNALNDADNDIARAAELLEMDKSNLYKYLKDKSE